MEPGDDEPGGQAVLRPLENIPIGTPSSPPLPEAGGDDGFIHLASCGDPVISALAGAFGPLDEEARQRGRPDDAYGALVRSIVGQQLSVKAARTIYGRLAALFGDRAPTPPELLAVDDEALKAVGLSRQKTVYLRDLARRVLDGALDLELLHELPDEDVAARLVVVKGLGRWTADMFLMFHLRRPDVLPVGDLGVRRAAERAYGLDEIPDANTLRDLAESWRPHRTLACIYLWKSLD